MTFRSFRMPALALGLFAAACRGGDAAPPEANLSEYTRLSSVQAPELEFTRVDSLVLGGPADGVFGITDLEMRDGNVYVVDEMAKTVHVFDPTGRRIRRMGRAGSGPGEFKMPASVALAEDGVLVVDPSHGKRLSLFDYDGKFIEARPFDTPTTATSIVLAGNRMVGMGVLGITDPGREGWNVLAVTDAAGKRVGEGCVIDERYVQSSRTGGMISNLTFGSAAAQGGRIYCTQTISPVVQVMDSVGRPVEQLRVAPPFYVPPRDKPTTPSQKAIFEYLGSFTAHVAFHPVEGGFVSVFSRFNEELGEVRYHLFVCQTGGETRCGIVQNVRKPVYVAGLDRVYVEEEVQPNQPLRVGVYRISPVRQAAG